MKRLLPILAAAFILMFSSQALGQDDGCYEKLKKAFDKRGAYKVSDDIHRNVIVVFFDDAESNCVKGKARVVNGALESIFIFYDDNTSELYVDTPLTASKEQVLVKDGISEVVKTRNNERIRVVFIDNLKPKQKSFKTVDLPDDL
jgi:hypothetical protein